MQTNSFFSTGQTNDMRPQFIRPPVGDTGLTLSLKKSSILEASQIVVQGMTMRQDLEPSQMGSYRYSHRPTAIRVVRGLGCIECNESYRAAVDRSFDSAHRLGKDPNTEPIEMCEGHE